MSTSHVPRDYGYGPASQIPSIKEGREYIATDTLKHTFDANDKRIELNPPADWTEENPNHPSFISGKPDVYEALKELEEIRKINRNVRVYGVLWDKTSSSMQRIFDSADITTDTTNFVYSGSVNPNYNNPFDKIYPWSECKQCNVDLDLYRALESGDDIRNAVVAWCGDHDFTTDGSNGFVGRYTPEFWYYGYEKDNKKFIVIADGEVEGFIHHKPCIRSHGFAVDDGDGGVTSNDGQPLANMAVSTIHTKATSGGFTLLDIYEYDADVALFMVEFASTDSQTKLGNGCSNLYNAPNFKVTAAATGATTVLVPVSLKANCIPGATLSFATSNNGGDPAKRRTVVSVADYDSTYCQVTFTPSINLDTNTYVNIHGKNNADSIGNKSGYIGINSKNNAWYRGVILYGNRYQYLLGAARQTGTGHLWLCPAPECDSYDGLNTSAFADTGITILSPNSNSWQQVGDYSVPEGKLAAWGPIKTAALRTGDAQYCVTLSYENTVPFVGCDANAGAVCGVLDGLWSNSSSASWWHCVACLLLRSP